MVVVPHDQDRLANLVEVAVLTNLLSPAGCPRFAASGQQSGITTTAPVITFKGLVGVGRWVCRYLCCD